MRAMKDSGIEWIGEIPQEWNVCRIKTLFEIIGGNGFKEHLQGNESGDYPFYKVSDINGDSIYSGRAANYISSLTAKEYAFNLVPSKAIIMSKIGEALKKNHRKISSTDCFIDNNLQALVPIADIDEVFYYYVFCCINMEWFDNGGTIPSVSNQKLRDFKIPLPAKNQQITIGQRIQKKCAEIDALIAAKEKTNALLKERRQSIIYEAVTKGLDPTVPTKDSGVEWIGKIPEGWELKRLKYLGSMQIGLTYSPEEIVADGALVLRSSNIQDGKIVHVDDVFVGKEIPEKLKVEEGDILICSRNGSRSLIGKNAVITEEFSGQTFGAFMTIFRGRFNFYIKYLLNSSVFDYYVGSFLTSTINQLTTSNLGNILVPVPSTEEEMWKIAKHIETECRTIDPIIAMNNETIQKLKEYRQSLIYEAVTGKVEI